MLRRRSAPPPEAELPLGRGWLFPRWLERQLDPDSPYWVPGSDRPVNATGRNGTLLGGLDSSRRALVDPAGLVVAGPGRWSVDVWFGVPGDGAGDGGDGEDGEGGDRVRWVFPSREAGVRQRLVDLVPVVETSLRLGGGDVVQRACASRAREVEVVLVEVTNETPHPIAVAVALRPVDLEGPTTVREVAVEGRQIIVDGVTAVWLDREPGRVLRSRLVDGDVAARLAHDESGDGDGITTCDGGLAHAVVVVPLVHGATIRATVALPGPDELRRRQPRPVRPALSVSPPLSVRPGLSVRSADPADVPPAEAVARGWVAHLAGDPTVSTPDPLLDQVVAACRSTLLLHATERGVHSDPFGGTGTAREAALMAETLGRWGRRREATVAVLALADLQGSDGSLPGSDEAWAETAALAVATADHWRVHRDRQVIASMAEPVVDAATWLDRTRRRHDPDRFLDGFWAVRGLQDAAMVLRAAHLDEEAGAAGQAAAELRVDLLSRLDTASSRCGGDVLPSAPDRLVDESSIDALAASWPTGFLPPDHPMIAATAAMIAERFTHGPAVMSTIGARGLALIPTLRLATAELRVGDRRALQRLRWVIEVASDTWTWPKLVHPRTGTGTDGPFQHGPTTAGVLAFVHQLLVVDRASPAGRLLAICPTFVPEWTGVAWEAKQLPTSVGRFGFAVRWHGSRPALLWELEPFDDVERVTITAPGLDPSFSSTERRGEVLLADPTVQAGR